MGLIAMPLERLPQLLLGTEPRPERSLLAEGKRRQTASDLGRALSG
jgi:hypothetical protein